jgi:hypothetical protein
VAKRYRRDGKREAFWRKALARQRNSGLNVRQWCSRQRLPETAFYFWRRTIAQRDRDAASAGVPVRQRLPRAIRPLRQTQGRQRPPVPMFVPMTVAMAACPELVERGREQPIVIRLRGGRVMRLPVGMDARRMAELVHAIEDASAPLLPAVRLPAVSLSNPSNGSKGVAS